MITTKQALGLDRNAMRLTAAREAIQHLGLLTPEAEDIIYHLTDDRFAEHHPRARCTAYRKDGEQLSKAELKSLGLRSNAFLSRKAFSEISEKGREDPLAAHETVLSRAVFTLFRYHAIMSARAQARRIPEFKDDYKLSTAHRDCPACNALDGKFFKGDDAPIFPVEGCTCDTANYTLSMHVDWLAEFRK